jgi:hypothetical protein
MWAVGFGDNYVGSLSGQVDVELSVRGTWHVYFKIYAEDLHVISTIDLMAYGSNDEAVAL